MEVTQTAVEIVAREAWKTGELSEAELWVTDGGGGGGSSECTPQQSGRMNAHSQQKHLRKDFQGGN